jgi:hypothetical protein
VRWLRYAGAVLAGLLLAEASKGWIMRTFEVSHPMVVVLPTALGLLVLWRLIEAVLAGIRAYRAPR